MKQTDPTMETTAKLNLWKEKFKSQGSWSWSDEMAYLHLKKLLSKKLEVQKEANKELDLDNAWKKYFLDLKKLLSKKGGDEEC